MQLKLFNHVYQFHFRSFYREKLISHWLDFYTDNWFPYQRLNTRYTFSLDEWAIFAMFAFVAVRCLVACFAPFYQTSRVYPIYGGSIYQMMGANPFYIELIFFLMSGNYLTNGLIVGRFRAKQFKWLEVIRFLEGHVPAGSLGLSTSESRSIRRQARLMMSFIHFTFLGLESNGLLVFALLCLVSYYPNWLYLLISSVWFAIYANFGLNVVLCMFMIPAYLYLISTLLRVRYKQQHRALKSTLYQAQHCKGIKAIGAKLQTIFTNLDKVLVQMDEYNRFWKYILSIALAWRLGIIIFEVYIMFYSKKLNQGTKLQFTMGLMGEVMCYFTMILQASCIPIDSVRIANQMHQFIAGNLIGDHRSRLKTMAQYEHMLHCRKVGIRLANNRVVQPFDILVMCREYTEYFCLMVGLSMKFYLD